MRRHNGFAMIAAMMLMALLAIIAIAVLSLSAADRRRAIKMTRTEARESCAYSGLSYAKTYFANNFARWDTFLSNPGQYNPIGTNGALPTPTTPAWGGGVVPAVIKGATPALSATAIATLRTARPDLFLDLDNDGLADVYVFIRDNQDELNQTPNNYQRDNDQNVIVGSVCISTTMVPRYDVSVRWTAMPRVDPDLFLVESMLSYNETGGSNAQASGTGNANDGPMAR